MLVEDKGHHETEERGANHCQYSKIGRAPERGLKLRVLKGGRIVAQPHEARGMLEDVHLEHTLPQGVAQGVHAYSEHGKQGGQT